MPNPIKLSDGRYRFVSQGGNPPTNKVLEVSDNGMTIKGPFGVMCWDPARNGYVHQVGTIFLKCYDDGTFEAANTLPGGGLVGYAGTYSAVGGGGGN